MRTFRLALSLTALVPSLAACSGAPPPPAESPSPSTAAEPPASAAERAASLMDRLDPQAKGWVHVDAARLRRSPMFTTLMAMSRAAGGSAAIDDADKQCGFKVVTAPKEMTISVGDNGFAIATTLTVPAEKALTCLRVLGKATDTKLDDGTPAVKLDNSSVAFVRGGMLYIGDIPSLARVLPPAAAAGADVKAHLDLSGDTVASAYMPVNDDDVTDAAGSIHASDTGWGLLIAVNFKKEDLAKAAAKALSDTMDEEMKSPEVKKTLEQIGGPGDLLKVDVDGKRVTARVQVAGTPDKLVAATGMLSVLAIHGARAYIKKAKQAEAPQQSAEIAKDLQAFVDKRKSAHKPPRFPASPAPVPVDVPAAKKYQSAPAEWSGSWKDIGFAIGEPQFFRYSFLTSKDGRHVVVKAEGDLDGDGKASLYELPLDINAKGEVVTGEAKETPEP